MDPWVRKIPWRRERLPTPVLWPGEFHGLYIVHGVTKNQTGLSDFHFHFSLLLGRWNRQKESKMAVAKRQERSKEGPRTRVKTSGRTNSTRG